MEQVIFRNTYVFINTYMNTIKNEKEAINFKKTNECMGDWRKERRGRGNYATILYSQK